MSSQEFMEPDKNCVYQVKVVPFNNLTNCLVSKAFDLVDMPNLVLSNTEDKVSNNNKLDMVYGILAKED